MNVHRIEHSAVLAFGFVIGVSLAICIAPGDVFLWVATGLVLGLCCRAFFIANFGEAWTMPFAHFHRQKKHPPQPTTKHR